MSRYYNQNLATILECGGSSIHLWPKLGVSTRSI